MPVEAPVSREQLASLVARASTLEERLRANRPAAPADDPVSRRRLEEWRERAAKSDPELFDEILSLRGIDAETATLALGSSETADTQAIPRWAELFAEGLSLAGEERIAPYASESNPFPFPFEQIAIPFVEAASATLSAGSSEWRGLPAVIRTSAQQLLLGWLSNICRPSLFLEHSIFRMKHSRSGQGMEIPLFLDNLLGGGLPRFFLEYSVLARAIGTVMGNWIEAMGEFAARLRSDYAELERTFSPGAELGELTGLQTGMSDPHHHGRTVFGLEFASGARVIYKPKSIDSDQALGGVLTWMNSRGLSLPLRAPVVLLRAGYGWAEYLRHTPCSNSEELARFYRRAGMLLALCRVLGATDLHHDNIIAVGEHPMIVDTETLITPPLRTGEPPVISGFVRAEFELEDSVVQSRMLPAWRSDKTGCFDMSGLGGVGGEALSIDVRQGTDNGPLGRQAVAATMRRNRNVPFPESMPAAPAIFTEDLVAGFREAYDLLAAHRSGLAAADGPLEKLGSAPMRLIFRDTETYFRLLKNSLEPGLVRSGVDRSIHLEALSRILLISVPRARHAPVVEEEKRSLEALDIPAFSILPRTRGLYAGGRCIMDEFFPECGYGKVLATLNRLDADDRERQIRIIRGTFYAKALNQKTTLSTAGPGAHSAGDPDPREFLEAALAIARELERHAIWGDDESCVWTGLHFHPALRVYCHGTLPAGLFSGTTGIAVFLAALEAITGGRAGFRGLAIAALRSVRQAVTAVRAKTKWNRSAERDMETALLAYPLLHAARLLDDATLVETARETTSLIASALAAEQRPYGIHFGTPGMLNGLLALHALQPQDEVLELARRCGGQLLRQTVSSPGREYALARLHAATGDPRFGASPDRQPWAPWIEGEAGAGLAELAAVPYERRDLNARIEAVLPAPLPDGDALWDGGFGQTGFLADAAQVLSRPELLVDARRRAAALLRRSRQAGGYRCHPSLPLDAFVPGFYHGLAGIGYELARLSSPGKLPSLLLWK
jgi:type 2 lantibiotic biosynthesis protein LanM